eukprot:6197274-Pleurochrysis_carterae.AAC.4
MVRRKALAPLTTADICPDETVRAAEHCLSSFPATPPVERFSPAVQRAGRPPRCGDGRHVRGRGRGVDARGAAERDARVCARDGARACGRVPCIARPNLKFDKY